MHWLPLVAMVIASALPFPHIPMARNVAATTDPGRHLGGRMADTDDAHSASHGPPSHEDYNTTPTDSNAPRLKTGPDTGPSDPRPLPSDPSFDSNSETERGQGRTSFSASQRDYNSQDKGTSEDYRSAGRVEGVEAGLWGGVEGLQGDELFLDAHPRVLFSPSTSPPGHPPLLLSGMLEEEEQEEQQQEEVHEEEVHEEVWDADQHIEGHGDREPDGEGLPRWAESPPGAGEGRHPAVRNKRSQLTPGRGEKSVCDMESVWVMDKKTAIDLHGRNVTILPVIQTLTGPLQQYFYETRCRQETPVPNVAPRGPGAAGKSPEPQGVAGGTCRGVDKKQWTSQCKARQSYVRALTRDADNRMGWRWIRIDSSCVCVLLSPANRKAGVAVERRVKV